MLISGPSGSGKSRMAKELKEFGFSQLITYTTRPMRPGEKESRDYHFVSVYEFESMILSDALAKFAVFKGNYYGTSKCLLSLTGNHTLIVEPNGAAAIHSFCKIEGIDHKMVFIDAPICVRHMLMSESRGKKTADERVMDTIKEQYLALGIHPDITTTIPGDHHSVLGVL